MDTGWKELPSTTPGKRTFINLTTGELRTTQTVTGFDDFMSGAREANGLISRSARHKPNQRQVAELPEAVYWNLYHRGIVQDRARFAAWLSKPENARYRTGGGAIPNPENVRMV